MAAAEKLFHGLKLISLCGSGAYGEVWYCEDISGRRLALKIVAKNRLGDAWKRELQGVINYHRITENSPYLLHIFHVDEDETHFYYTMEAADSADAAEYVPDTLARRLQNGPLPPRQLFPVLAGVFNGLAAIHQAGFAHRDIKPDNIVFVGGVPKLSDIGLVSALSNSMTRLAGTLEFLPPEERTGDTESTDRASRQRNDLYAFGKVVYCAATGLEPGQYPSLPSRIGLSPELKLFLRLAFKLCARESQLRTDDLQSLYAELKLIERQLATGETVADKVRYAIWKLRNRLLSEMLALTRALRKTGWILILLALLAAVLGVWQWRKYRTEIETLKRPKKTAAAKNTPKPPKPPKPPEPSKFKPYVLDSLGLRMSIPSSWQAMSEEHIRAQVDEMTKELNETTKDENAKKLLRHAIERAKTWKGMIRCDLYDAIEISRISAPAAQTGNMWTMPLADLKRVLLAQFGMLKTKDSEVYDIRRIMLAGRRCVVFDFTLDRHDRIKNCILLDDSGVVIIALTADAATFDRRVKEFDAMLNTLEFSGPAPKYDASPPKPSSAPVTEPTPPKTTGENLQTVTDPRERFTIRIPASWKVLPEERIQQLVSYKSSLAEKRALSPVERAQLQALSLMVENRGTLIHCNFDDPDWHDDIEITPEIQYRKAEIWSHTNAELRRQLLSGAAEAGNTDLVVYSVEHTEVADRNAILLEFSSNPRHDRSFSCIVFTDDDSALQLVLSARNDKFPRLRAEFENALKTLKLPPPRPGAAKTDAKTSPAPAVPKPPAAPNTREYVNRRNHFTMRVPLHWELLGRRYIEQEMKEKRRHILRSGKKVLTDQWRIDILNNILKNGGDCFRCQVRSDFSDCVEIVPSDFNKDGLWYFADDYLKTQFQLEANKQAIPFSVYDLRRDKVDGRDCFVMECGDDTSSIYKLVYQIFVDDHHMLTIAIAAKRETFLQRKKELEAAIKTLKFSGSASANIYDLSNKKVIELEIGGSRIARYKNDDILNGEVEIPKTWFEREGSFYRFGENVLFEEYWPGIVAWEHTPAFAIENRYLDRADSNIQIWSSSLISTDTLRNGSAKQLKDAVRKDFYFEFALPSTKFWDKGLDVTQRMSVPEFMKRAQTVLPQESIAVGELKRFSIDGQPAVYAEIDSPLTHRNRKFVYCLVAPEGLKNCFVILLNADGKKNELRKKQFFEFCRHFKIFTK